MAHAGEYHRHAVLVSRTDHFLVPDAAARLNHGDGARVDHDVEPVTKRVV